MSLQTNCVACDELPGIIPIQGSVLTSKMFQDITGLKTKSHYTICKSCQSELRSSYNFRKRCREIYNLYNSSIEDTSPDPLSAGCLLTIKREPGEEEIEESDQECSAGDEDHNLDDSKSARKRKQEEISHDSKKARMSQELNTSDDIDVDSHVSTFLCEEPSTSDDYFGSLLNAAKNQQMQESGALVSEIFKTLSRFKRQMTAEIRKEVSRLGESSVGRTKIKKISKEDLSKFISKENFTKVSSVDQFEAFIADIENDDKRDAMAQMIRLMPDATRCYNKLHGKISTMIEFLFDKAFIAESLKWGEMIGTTSGKICLVNYPDILDLATKVASTEDNNGELVLPPVREIKASFQLYFKHRAKKLVKELNAEYFDKLME